MISSALKKIWDDLAIEKGDTVLIHSNIRPLLRHFLKKNIKLTPEDILDSLLMRISKSGNLIKSNALKIDNKVLTDENKIIQLNDFGDNKILKVSFGKKKHYLIKII